MSNHRYAESTLGDRMVAAFASLLFSLPAAGLLWFFFNIQLGLFTNKFAPGSYLVIGIGAFAVVAFAFPRLAPSMIGKLYGFLLWIGKGW